MIRNLIFALLLGTAAQAFGQGYPTPATVIQARNNGTVAFTASGFVPMNFTGGGCSSSNVSGVLTINCPNTSCPTCVLSPSLLTSNGVVIGQGSQNAATISVDTTTTDALFATAGAPAFRAIATGDLPTAIPIGNIGSAGLSGTSPITISIAGAIGCATCTTNAAGLTNTALMTGGGSQASQTPSATATLSSGGAMSLPSTLSATQLTSTVSTGTAPLVVTSTTAVANLNAASLSGATFASPGAIGSSSASTGKFTSLAATGVIAGGNTVRLAADSSGITATTPGTAFLTLGTLTASTNYSFTCELLYSQATATVLDGFSVQAATNAATRWDAWGTMYTANPVSTTVTGSEGSSLNVTTTTSTPVVSATPGAITTVFQARLSGSIQVGASVPTVNIAAFTGNASDAVTIKAGSFCTVTP